MYFKTITWSYLNYKSFREIRYEGCKSWNYNFGKLHETYKEINTINIKDTEVMDNVHYALSMDYIYVL